MNQALSLLLTAAYAFAAIVIALDLLVWRPF
jgi:hypothetical protein